MEYKIALIADIHGNISALETIMEDAKNIGCNEIIHLGE